MVYTVGLIAIYEPLLDAGPIPKLGRRPGYHGGWVWRTPEEAWQYLKLRNSLQERRVYAVDADWDADTYEAPGQPTRCLIRDAAVVRLPSQPSG